MKKATWVAFFVDYIFSQCYNIIMSNHLDLETRTYTVNLNGNTVQFTLYGEEDDLNTLDMFITFLMQAARDNLGDDE